MAILDGIAKMTVWMILGMEENSALGLSDSLMMSGIWFAFESMDGDNIFYFPVLMGVICMDIQMGMVLVLAVSRDEYKEKDALNKKYLKMQEEWEIYHYKGR